MTTFEKAKAGLGEVFKVIPKGKFGQVFQDAHDAELGLIELASALVQLRGYFLEQTGEESPFVKRIDELVPRAKGGDK